VVSRGEELRQQAQRKKAITLVVLLCCAGFVWSRTLFANDEVDRTAVIASVAPSATAVARATAHPAAAGSSSKVVSYETALQRLEVWPKALNRKVFHGSIEEITPINNLLNTVMEEAVEASNDTDLVSKEIVEVIDEQYLMSIDINSFDLDLSTTAIFGGTAVAIINGEQYRNGDYLELQFDGKSIRYEVSAIHSRRVVLHLGESEFELKIANFKNASKSLNTNPGRLPGQRDSD
jgi:hypothetical protein